GRQVLDKYNCASCHQIRPGSFDFKMTPDVLVALEATHLTAQAGERSDIPFPGHSAWTAPTAWTDKGSLQGYIWPAYSKGGDPLSAWGPPGVPRSATFAVDVVYSTEAFRFTGSDRRQKDVPAGSLVYLPRGSYTRVAPHGGTWTEQMIPYIAAR